MLHLQRELLEWKASFISRLAGFLVFICFFFFNCTIAGILFSFFLFKGFIYLWPHWVLIAVHGLSLVAVSRDHPSCSTRASHRQWLLSLQSTSPRARGPGSGAPWALERRLSSHGPRAQLWHVGHSWTRGWALVPCTGTWVLIHCTTKGALLEFLWYIFCFCLWPSFSYCGGTIFSIDMFWAIDS